MKSVSRLLTRAAAIAPLLALLALSAPAAQAGPVYPHLFIAIDDRAVNPSGTYAGLVNPNAGRLSLLYGHSYEDTPLSNHFHGIGIYSYTGPAASPTVVDTSTNNSIPEPSSLAGGGPRLSLTAGTGAYAGFLRSSLGPTSANAYEGTGIRTYASLNGSVAPGEAELYNSGVGRWRNTMSGATVAMELVSVTAGLRIGDEAGNLLLDSAGDLFTLGAGDTLTFAPVFFTDANATPGVYNAEFRLRDTTGTAGESGRFSFSFQVAAVPETGTLPMAACAVPGLGLLLLGVTRRRRHGA
jgi:hypothetical protein